MCIIRHILICLIAFSTVSLLSCGHKKVENQQDEDILVSIGDSTLRLSEVVSVIPRGLDVADSVNMFHEIVDKWVENLILADYAEKNIPDLDKIDRMVEDYRNSLIVHRYLQTMTENAASGIPESRIKEYYDAHHSEMILEQPIVKGAFLKVAENDESLDKLRKWMAQFTEQSVDNIEKSGLRQASQYEYFRDEWHEWSAISEQIPYRFFDADAFVSSTKNFETSDAGLVYLLHISEFVPSGKEMPYEFARLKISEILRNSDIGEHRESLIHDIYKDRIRSGVLRPGLYDPLSGKMKDRK